MPEANPSVRHEPSDASFNWVMITIILAALAGVLIHLGVLLFLKGYASHQGKIKESPFPLAAEPSRSLPPEPRLEQIDRVAEIETPNVRERLAAREEALRRYGRTGEKGFVHIPVERAMDLLAGKLPARPEPPAGQQRRAGGLVTGGESNSGRLFRKGGR